MSEIEYEFVPGSPEQVEVFLDLQRMLLKLYNKWPGDTAIAVFSASLGCAVALIETQYKIHLEECEKCRERYKSEEFDLDDVARSNYQYYYGKGLEQSEIDKKVAADLVKSFFKKGEH